MRRSDMSGVEVKADSKAMAAFGRKWPTATDIALQSNFRFWGKSGSGWSIVGADQLTSWQTNDARTAPRRSRRAKFIDGELWPNTKCQGWSRTVAARCYFVSF
jgi:hypothetical protein